MQISEKTRFVLLRGVLGWGLLAALLPALLKRLKTHQLESPMRIIANAVIFMVCGIPFGLYLWETRETRKSRVMTRAQQIGRTILFIGLMLGLLFVYIRYL